MDHLEERKSRKKSTWFLSRMTNWITGKTKKLYFWLFPKKESYPENESGEIIRRALANKSWFDKLSSGWVKQPFSIKMLVVASMTLLSMLIGIWAEVPVLLSLSCFFVLASLHVSLVAHERHRISRAKIFATETKELNDDLEKSKKLLDESLKTVEHVAAELNGHSAQMKENAQELGRESAAIHAQGELLGVTVEELREATTDLIAQEHAVQHALEQTADHLNGLGAVVVETRDRVGEIGDITTQCAEAVRNISSIDVAYAAVVARIGVFAGTQKTTRPSAFDASLEAINGLNAELDENDRLIKQMQLSMTPVFA